MFERVIANLVDNRFSNRVASPSASTSSQVRASAVTLIACN